MAKCSPFFKTFFRVGKCWGKEIYISGRNIWDNLPWKQALFNHALAHTMPAWPNTKL